MKRYITYLFCSVCLLCGNMKAQTSLNAEGDEDEGRVLSVMVIPYNPSYYRTDIDQYLKAIYPGNNPEEVRNWLKSGLSENVGVRIINADKNTGTCLSAGADEIQAIYASLAYEYDKRDLRIIKQMEKHLNLSGRIKKIDKSTLYYESDKKPKVYMNAVIGDPEVLFSAARKYSINLFVFINQVEIRTLYKKREGSIERRIKVHYSIYDRYGEQVFGDIVILRLSEMRGDIDNVILSCFPVVSN
jgi:hypothetical protein